MDVSCQFSLYPLGQTDLGPAIDAALSALSARGLSFEPGPMSTIVRGPLEEVFAALADAFGAAGEHATVLVATVSNACPLS